MIRHIRYHGPDGWPLYAALLESLPSAAEPQDLAPLVLLHGGGPDHESLLPLVRLLADDRTVILPDVRGYGLFVCNDLSRHTWQQYSDDVAALLDHLGYAQVVLGGAGLGATISLRTALAHADRVIALVLISVEDIGDDAAKPGNRVHGRVRCEGASSGHRRSVGTDPARACAASELRQSLLPPEDRCLNAGRMLTRI